jgi:hypothetical protein
VDSRKYIHGGEIETRLFSTDLDFEASLYMLTVLNFYSLLLVLHTAMLTHRFDSRVATVHIGKQAKISLFQNVSLNDVGVNNSFSL